MNEYFRERIGLMVFTRTSGARAWELVQSSAILDRKPARTSRGYGTTHGCPRAATHVQAAGTLLLLASGGWLIARGDIGIGGFAMAYGYMSRPAKVLCDWMSWHREAGEATERVRRIGTLLHEPEDGRSNRFWWINVALLTRHFCRSLIGDHVGRPRVGEFQFAVLTWQGFLILSRPARVDHGAETQQAAPVR
ncbi:hypothetical protein OG470_19940 [Micromonospora sp. NBC_00389]|uniref:hypothetical protein n=1 Tax=Micromonospora sp. NBC_00389 TaxID=2903586 RepID=UPI002E207BA9